MDEEEIYALLKDKKAKDRSHSNQPKEECSAGPFKAKSKSKSKMSEEERKERIRMGLIRKKECDSKALLIVERLLETHVDKEWLRDAANFLSQSHYEDIVEERFVINLCGYPLCDSKLKDIPNQKYRISTSQNRVYDISKRKKFCSNECFKRSNYYFEQIPASPLWLREEKDNVRVEYWEEISNPELKFVGSDGNGEVLTFPTLTKDSIKDPEPAEEGDKEDMNENSSEHDSDDLSGFSQSLDKMKICDNKPKPIKSKMVDSMQNVEYIVEQWFSIDTLRLLQGDDFVRTRLKEVGITTDNILDICGDETMKPELKAKYLDLCRSLKLTELKDDDEGERPINKEVNEKFGDLRGEVESQTLKVESFYGITANKTLEIKEREGSEELKPVLPMLDKFAQIAQRRKIVRDQLNRVLPDVLQLCGLTKFDVRDNLKNLILTFDLNAENIVLNTKEWTLMTVNILVMLGQFDSTVKENMKKPQSKKFLNMLLLEHNSSVEHLERYLFFMSGNIHNLLNKMY